MKLKLKTFWIMFLIFAGSWVLIGLTLSNPSVHGLYETLETFLYFKLFSCTADPYKDLVIIDEEDNEYERDVYAQLIAKLASVEAKVMACDVLFYAPRDSSRNFKLIQATSNSKESVIHSVEFIEQNNQVVIPDRFHLEAQPIEGMIQANGALLPFPELLNVTDLIGHIIRSSDETLRTAQYYPLVVKYNGQLYPSLSLLSAAEFLDCRIDFAPRHRPEKIILVKQDNMIVSEIPINHRGETLINFIRTERFSGKMFSFEKAFKLFGDEKSASAFRNKVVLIGNSFDSQERWLGPHSYCYPNLIIHATVISQILNEQSICSGILWSIAFTFVVVILSTGFLTYVDKKYPLRRSIHVAFYYLFCVSLFLIFSLVLVRSSIKSFVVLPYLSFLFSAPLTKHYLDGRRLFVSYSGEDNIFTLSLAEDLKRLGIDPWLFQLDLTAGDTWKAMTYRAIQRCGTFLVILSDASVHSRYVNFEWLAAENLGKRIIPVLLGEEENIPDELRKYQYCDFRNKEKYKFGVEELAKALGANTKSPWRAILKKIRN